jgi:hypothetical protein
MFTFFSKKKSQKIVEKIHNEIDTAQERLLQEAKRIIETNKPDDNKVERLKAVGFTSAAPVVKHDSASKILVEGFRQAKLIEYYKQNYPFQKFLTESELNRICEKYGLVYAPVNRYLGDVPEKNLRDIERMPPLKHFDAVKTTTRIYYTGSFKKYITKSEKQLYRKGIEVEYVGSEGGLNREFEKVTGLEKHTYETLGWNAELINKAGLFIAAPAAEFDLTGLKKVSKLGFATFTKIGDPIVFRYVRGGIQVITKWGLEASDEALTNEIEN